MHWFGNINEIEIIENHIVLSLTLSSLGKKDIKTITKIQQISTLVLCLFYMDMPTNIRLAQKLFLVHTNCVQVHDIHITKKKKKEVVCCRIVNQQHHVYLVFVRNETWSSISHIIPILLNIANTRGLCGWCKHILLATTSSNAYNSKMMFWISFEFYVNMI